MIREFQIDDLESVNQWLVDRGCGPMPKEAIPTVGCIWPGVAVGFLYSTDSAIALLENFVSNPNVPRGTRSKAINVITMALMRVAQGQGAKKLFAITRNASIMNYCKKHKFEDTGTFSVFAKEL